MSEKVYSTMKSAGIMNLVVGIVIIVVGVVTGICVLVSGARLLNKKSDILF